MLISLYNKHYYTYCGIILFLLGVRTLNTLAVDYRPEILLPL